MAAIKLTNTISRKEVSLGISATEGKKCGFLEITAALRQKLEAAGKGTNLPAEGTVLVGVELGAEFSFNFGMQNNGGAVVPSIRGINPLTGIRAGIEPWTSGRGDYCPADPLHGRLGHNGHCKTCNHTWAAANYLVAAPGAELPGWRTGEGEFRKFVATTDMLKDVATAIDASSTVPALGFAYYKSTKPAQSWSPFFIYDWYTPWRRYPSWFDVWPNYGGTIRGGGMLYDASTVNTSYFASTTSCNVDGLSYKSRSATSFDGGDMAMPEPLVVGASKTVTEVNEQKTPTLLPQDLLEEPVQVIDAVLVSWEYLKGLEEAANSVVESGPMKGIPLS